MLPLADWIHITGGGAVAVIGLALLYFALLHDRSRGRRRCPECWYDMRGSPGVVCSECGYAARREKKLSKTRRRWRLAAIAALIAMTGWAAMLYPWVTTDRWPTLIPTTAIVLMGEERRDNWPQLRAELHKRMRHGALWDWQVRRLYRQAVKSEAVTLTIASQEFWPEGVRPTYLAVARASGDRTRWLSHCEISVRFTPRHAGADETLLVKSSRSGFRRFDPETGALVASTNWKDAQGRLPALEAGEHVVDFDVVVDVSIGDSNKRKVRVWDQEAMLHVRIGGGLASHLLPVEDDRVADALRTQMWIATLKRSIRVVRTFGTLEDLGSDGALGLRFELLRGDEIVARTRGWWRNNTACRGSDYLPWDWTNLGESGFKDADAAWRMRITGDPALALLAFDDRSEECPPEARYWSGSVEIPLVYDRASGLLVPEWRLGDRADWGWNCKDLARARVWY